MNRLLSALGLATILLPGAPAGAQTTYTCGEGTVHGVQAVTETVTLETVTTRRGDDGDVKAFVVTKDEQRDRAFIVTVQLGGRLFTSRSAGDPYGTLDPLRLATGDAIGICVNATQMILERPDGTDYRAAVMRVVTETTTSRGTR